MEQNDSEDTKISGHLGSSPNLLNYHLFLKRYEQGNLLKDIDNKTVKKSGISRLHPKVSLLGVDSLWDVCTFIPADWGS